MKVKRKGLNTCYTLLTRVRLATSSALQSQKWQLIDMSQWCRSTLCGHPLPALMHNCTHGAASRHTIAPISYSRPSPRSCSYYSFLAPLWVGGWVGLMAFSLRYYSSDLELTFHVIIDHWQWVHWLVNTCILIISQLRSLSVAFFEIITCIKGFV